MTDKDVKKQKSSTKAKAQKAKAAAKEEKVTLGKTGSKWAYYVTANEEAVKWDMHIAGNIYRGLWNGDHTHVVWRIPSDLAGRMEAHVFFEQGRIIRGDDD